MRIKHYKLVRYLATLRKEAKITQTEVGKDLGYSYQNISMFENGHIDSLEIFLWYVENVMGEADLLKLLNDRELMK